MNENIKYYLLYAIAYGLVLLLGEIIYRRIKGGTEWSRSFAHLSVGIITLLFPWLFTSHWWVLILSLQSCLVLWLTQRLKLIPSHHRIAGKSAGSYLFFASVYLCFISFFFTGRKELFVVPLLVLSISDVAAAQIGRRLGRKKIGARKTMAGSTAFFLSSLVVLFLSYYYYIGWSIVGSIAISILIALLTTISEAFSPHGIDNFSIPITMLTVMQIGFIL